MPPATSPEPDVDVATVLNGAGGLGAQWLFNPGDPTTANIFVGPVRPQEGGIPANAIFVLAFGGPAPLPYLGGVASGSMYFARVQVVVRSAPDAYGTGINTARDVRTLLHKIAPSGYIAAYAEQSEPMYLAQDEAGNHLWSINFRLDRTGTA